MKGKNNCSLDVSPDLEISAFRNANQPFLNFHISHNRFAAYNSLEADFMAFSWEGVSPPYNQTDLAPLFISTSMANLNYFRVRVVIGIRFRGK